MVTYANLGGMGVREGIPVFHTWEPPPPGTTEMPVAATSGLKWCFWVLVLLPLFLFRGNRVPQAWWVWLPVVVSAGGGTAIICLLSNNEWVLPQAACAFVVGLAALWLLMPYLESRNRIVASLKALMVLAGFSLLAFVPTLMAERSGWLDFRPYLAALLALASLAVALALTLGGISVRHRFGCVRFVCWLAVWIALGWTAIATPFVGFALLDSHVDWGESFVTLALISGITLSLLLPLVLLSFFQPFYRARFLDFVRMPEAAPPAKEPVPPVLEEIGQRP